MPQHREHPNQGGGTTVRKPCPYCHGQQLVPITQRDVDAAAARLHANVNPGHPKAIAVDFDGVIHRYSRGWQDGTIYDPPLTGAIESLFALTQTYAVFIHTTRTATDVATWLSQYGFNTVVDVDGPQHPKREFWNEQGTLLITDRKLPAFAYIDDRAIRFQSWSQALVALTNAENPPEHPQPTYEQLLVVLARINALHRRNENTWECEYCSARDYPDYAVPWPCETIRALTPTGKDGT